MNLNKHNNMPLTSLMLELHINNSHAVNQICCWIKELCCKEKRLHAMRALSYYRLKIQNIGILLWHSFGSVTSLIQEIVDIFPAIMLERLTPEQAHRACLALSLLQTIVAQTETKDLLLRANLLLFLVPLLKSNSHQPTMEYVRLAILGVIHVVLQNATAQTLRFVLASEIMPNVLRLLETGSELCKASCAYIIYQIIYHEIGMAFVCAQAERFTHVIFVLGKVVIQQQFELSIRVLKQIIRCYDRLADNPRVRAVLVINLPYQLCDSTFRDGIQQDDGLRITLLTLKRKVGVGLGLEVP